MKKTEHEKKNILEGLRKLAKEAIEIRKRIKSDTKKLSEIKDKFIEKSKDKNFSFTIDSHIKKSVIKFISIVLALD